MIVANRKTLLLFCLAIFALLVIYELRKQDGKRPALSLEDGNILEGKDYPENNGDRIIKVMIVFSNAIGKDSLKESFKECVQSLLHFTSVKVELNIAGDSPSQEIATGILNSFTATEKERVRVSLHDIKRLEKRVDELISDRIQYFRNSKTSYYGGSLFFLSMVLHQIFPNWKRVIVLDVDLKFRKDIAVLWNYFLGFEKEEVIGIGYEMQPVYNKIFSGYRRKHRESKIGEPLPDGFPGFNSGILLLDLEKIRHSPEYQKYLSKEFIERLVKRYEFQGHLGDQDFYTLLGAEEKKFFHPLPCQWNRQLCSYWKNKGFETIFSLYNSCQEPIFVMHGNCHTPIPNS